MKRLLQSPLFKIGTTAVIVATGCVTALFFYALHVPTQPLTPQWRTTVIAPEGDADIDGAGPTGLGAVSAVH